MQFTPFLKKEIQALPPSAFALVMATGIISIAAHSLEYPTIANILYWLNHVLYGLLLLMLLFRMLFYWQRFSSDIATYGKGAGILTLVAATAILGSQHVLLKHYYTPALGLLYAAAVLWVLLMYAYFVITTIKDNKPSLEQGMKGSWLLMVVATQTMAILGILLLKQLPFAADKVLFTTLCLYLLGLVFYLILITLIFYRLTFYPTKPDELTAPFWINMGALASTTLASSTLIQQISAGSVFYEVLPFLKGLSLLSWGTATWWIPVILLLEGWRYGVKKHSISYKANAWSMVFCLGMYTACSLKLSEALKISWLKGLPQVFLWIALGVWAITFLFMCLSPLRQHKKASVAAVQKKSRGIKRTHLPLLLL